MPNSCHVYTLLNRFAPGYPLSHRLNQQEPITPLNQRSYLSSNHGQTFTEIKTAGPTQDSLLPLQSVLVLRWPGLEAGPPGSQHPIALGMFLAIIILSVSPVLAVAYSWLLRGGLVWPETSMRLFAWTTLLATFAGISTAGSSTVEWDCAPLLSLPYNICIAM